MKAKASAAAGPGTAKRSRGEGEEVASAPITKMDSKLQCTQVPVRVLLAAFSDDDWFSIKESRFTIPLSKLTTFRAEASSAGDETNVKKVDIWISGFTAGKMTMKGHRECLKSKDQHAKFLLYMSQLITFKEFLDSLSIKVCVDFELWMLRACLWTAMQSLTIDGAVKVLFDKGLVQVTARAINGPEASSAAVVLAGGRTPSGSRFISVSSWLRSILWKALGDRSQAVDDDSATLQCTLKTWIAQGSSIVGQMRMDSEFASHCNDLIDEVAVFNTVLNSATDAPNARASEVKKAVERFNTAEMKPLRDVFVNSAVGKVVMSAASELIQVSSKDEVGNAKMARAMNILLDDRLPHWGYQDSSQTPNLIMNFGDIIDMTIVESLEESLTHVVEALRMWSTAGRDLYLETMNEWLNKLTATIVFFDTCGSVFLQALLARGEFGKLLFWQ